MSAAQKTALTAAAVVTVSALQVAAGAGDVGATGTDAEQHCLLRAEEEEFSARLVQEEMPCYPTLAEALAAIDDMPVIDSTARFDSTAGRSPAALVALSNIALATHFDGANYAGDSVTVYGTSCDAFVNFSTTWINRVSSTGNYCGTVRFFDGYDKGGDDELLTSGWWNLGALNNRAQSAYYGT
jgi:hypothetical protein